LFCLNLYCSLVLGVKYDSLISWIWLNAIVVHHNIIILWLISGSGSLVLGIKYVQICFCCNKAKKKIYIYIYTLRVFLRPHYNADAKAKECINFQGSEQLCMHLVEAQKRPCCVNVIDGPKTSQLSLTAMWAGLTCCTLPALLNLVSPLNHSLLQLR